MNLFVVDYDPVKAAQALPDKHVVKMCVENAQMLAVALGPLHGYGWGHIRKKDGSFYSERAHFNHPSTKWVRECHANTAWAIVHGLALCHEYMLRYDKIHAAVVAHLDSATLFKAHAGSLSQWKEVKEFARAMPDSIKNDKTIDSVQAYRKYVVEYKPWATWKLQHRRPEWWCTSGLIKIGPSMLEKASLEENFKEVEEGIGLAHLKD